jgi:hypothetical protein
MPGLGRSRGYGLERGQNQRFSTDAKPNFAVTRELVVEKEIAKCNPVMMEITVSNICGTIQW